MSNCPALSPALAPERPRPMKRVSLESTPCAGKAIGQFENKILCGAKGVEKDRKLAVPGNFPTDTLLLSLFSHFSNLQRAWTTRRVLPPLILSTQTVPVYSDPPRFTCSLVASISASHHGGNFPELVPDAREDGSLSLVSTGMSLHSTCSLIVEESSP